MKKLICILTGWHIPNGDWEHKPLDREGVCCCKNCNKIFTDSEYTFKKAVWARIVLGIVVCDLIWLAAFCTIAGISEVDNV